MADVTPNFKVRNPIENQMVDASAWRWRVLQRAHGRCYHCGGRRDLAAHHLMFKGQCHKSFHNDPRNGVALCRNTCHTELHNGDIHLDPRGLLTDTLEMLRTLGLEFAPVSWMPMGRLASYWVSPTS